MKWHNQLDLALQIIRTWIFGDRNAAKNKVRLAPWSATCDIFLQYVEPAILSSFLAKNFSLAGINLWFSVDQQRTNKNSKLTKNLLIYSKQLLYKKTSRTIDFLHIMWD